MAACLSWTAVENLPVLPTASSLRISIGSCFQASNSRDCSVPMGRRLLKWPRGAPSIAVQRQLGWLDLWPARLMSAAGLWARCLCLPSSCPAARVARFAVTQASSWAAAIQTELQQIGVPDPSCCGIAPIAPRTVTHRWSAPMVSVCKKCHLQSFVHSVSGRRAKHRFIVAVLVTGRRRHTCTPWFTGSKRVHCELVLGVLPDADIMTSRMGVPPFSFLPPALPKLRGR